VPLSFIAFRKSIIALTVTGVTGFTAALTACSSNQDNAPTDASTSSDSPTATGRDSAPPSDAGGDTAAPDASDAGASDVVIPPSTRRAR